ncbi:hypothetical protein GCM10020000_23420 [Streptomyces olivoverticillatus]
MSDTLVRVEKGTADAEELAAVTAVLLARAAAGNPDATPPPAPAAPRPAGAAWSARPASGRRTAGRADNPSSAGLTPRTPSETKPSKTTRSPHSRGVRGPCRIRASGAAP